MDLHNLLENFLGKHLKFRIEGSCVDFILCISC